MSDAARPAAPAAIGRPWPHPSYGVRSLGLVLGAQFVDAVKGATYRRLGLWWRALRPKTLSLAAVPVFGGTVWSASTAGAFRIDALILALFAALSIQVGTNLWNDALDDEHGVDRGSRLGPPRATASGALRGRSVRRAALVAFGLAAVAGAYLVAIGGLVVLAIGLAAIACGLLYSAGPRPLATTPLGEVFVVAFFGVAGVAGTVVLHGGEVSLGALLLGVIIGLPAAAMLLVNNHRDRVNDDRAGRVTLAILIGVDGSRRLYALLIGTSTFGPLALAPLCAVSWVVTAALVVVAGGEIRRFSQAPVDRRLNRFLAATARFQLLLLLGLAATFALCGPAPTLWSIDTRG